jgi:hypothetical protein
VFYILQNNYLEKSCIFFSCLLPYVFQDHILSDGRLAPTSQVQAVVLAFFMLLSIVGN